MFDYLQYIKNITDYFQAINHLIAESYLVLQILNALPSKYSNIVTFMIAYYPLLGYLKLHSFLLVHES